MPYKSEAQRKYFHANKKKLEKQGVDVEEWDKESKGMKLPKKSIRKSTSRNKH
jgi:hypothetical protein